MKNARFGKVKGFIAGVLLMAILSGTVVMASPQMREIFFGVSVNFNGAAVQFDEDSRPFITGGRTFLPVRAIADIAGLDVDFDAETNTVLLTGEGSPRQMATSPTPITQSFFTSSQIISEELGQVGRGGDGTGFVRTQDSVTMSGQSFDNAIVFRASVDDPALGSYSVHRLDGRYTTFTGTIGRVSGQSGGTLWRIWGDGVVIAQFEHSMSDGRTINNEAPRAIEVDVTGVNVLTIETTIWSHQTRAEFAIAGSTR